MEKNARTLRSFEKNGYPTLNVWQGSVRFNSREEESALSYLSTGGAVNADPNILTSV